MNVKENIASLIRAGLHMLAFYFVSKGFADSADADAFVSGGTEILVGFVLMLGAFAWSMLKNRFNKFLFREALYASPMTSESEVKNRVFERIKAVSPI